MHTRKKGKRKDGNLKSHNFFLLNRPLILLLRLKRLLKSSVR